MNLYIVKYIYILWYTSCDLKAVKY